MSTEVGTSAFSTPSVSFRGNAEIAELTSSSIGQPVMDTLGSVVPNQFGLVEPRISKRRDQTIGCENWASWPRHTFVEHLKLIYPQISNVADKTFLEMIKDLKFEYNVDDVRVDTLRIRVDTLRKIMDHYNTRASSEEAEAVRLLIEKINVVNVLNWQPYFDAMALQCDIRMPIATVKDFRF